MTSFMTSWLASVRCCRAMFTLAAVLFMLVPRVAFAGGTPSMVTLSVTTNPADYGQANMLTATMDSTETGTVQFLDGATVLGTPTISGGTATLALGTLTVGVHMIVAQYSGDATFAGSSSSPLSLTIDASDTMAAIASSSNPSTYGGSVTFTATLTTSDGSIPTGSVSFVDGATTIGSGTLDGTGVATFITTALTAGSHSIVASYAGNTDFNASSSTSLAQTVDVASSSLALSSATNPSVFGQSVQIIATATAGSGVGIPTGTVTFSDGATVIGSAALDGSGQAILTTTSLAVGTHTISAAYGGDTNFTSSSTATSLSQVVDKAATSTGLMSSSNPSIIDASVTFTATVSATAPGAGTPTGTVTFKDGATVLGSPSLSSGVATFTISTLTIGTHPITAVYAGDTNFTGSSSSGLSQVVTVDGVMVALGSSSNPSTFGSSVTFTATVSADDSGTGTPSGNVTFNDGATSLGTKALSGGVATLTTSALTGGTHSITAVYGGDTNHASGSSSGLSQVVDTAATQTVLASSHNPSVFGQSVTFTATVSSLVTGTLTGTVTFKDSATTLGTIAVSSGSAALSTAALSVGTHSITATYSGDTNFASSTSTTTSQVVNKAGTSTVVISSSSPSLVGTSVTFTATVSVTSPGAGSPSGTVTFKDGSTTLGTGSVNSSGVATFSTSALTAGSHTITAVYGGDSSFNGSTSSSITQNVSTHGATLTVAAAPNPTVYGTAVVFTATVSGSSGTPTGMVTFKDGTTTLGSGALNGSGVATFSTASLAAPLGAGTHSIAANYGGDSTYATATGSTSLVIALASTTTIISTSANPITTGTSVTFMATITAAVNGMTGQVEFLDGTTSLGLAAVAKGSASFTTSTLTAAGHAMTANYKGDSNFSPSTSTALIEKVSAPGGDAGADAGAIDAGDDASLGQLGEPASDDGPGCSVTSESPVPGFGSVLAILGLGVLLGRRRSKKR